MATISDNMVKTVYFSCCPEYNGGLYGCLAQHFLTSSYSFRGTKVLVKPNLVAGNNSGLGCTNPFFVFSVCQILMDMGAKVFVGDSPAFGSARAVARKIGLLEFLRPLGVELCTLGRKKRLKTGGHKAVISREALNADVIVNLPKLKAHSQMRVTAGVKNLFGCVCGMQKAIWHARLGADVSSFSEFLLAVSGHFPNTFTLLDAITVMQGSGPTKGRPLQLGAVVAADDPFALDTAVYEQLGLRPNEVPMWRAAQDKGIPAADPGTFCLTGHFSGLWTEMELPRELKSPDFSPLFLCTSLARRTKDLVWGGK